MTVDMPAGIAAGAALDGNADAPISNFAGVESVIGTPYADTIIGHAGPNVISGGGGGGGGGDIIIGSGGADVLSGDGGNDTISFADSTDPVMVDLFSSEVTVLDGSEIPTTIAAVKNVIGSSFDDILIATPAHNAIFGSGDDDVIIGAGGDDSLHGEAGNNVLLGGSGDDVLDGGDGSDNQNGNGGIDSCVYGENVTNCES